MTRRALFVVVAAAAGLWLSGCGSAHVTAGTKRAATTSVALPTGGEITRSAPASLRGHSGLASIGATRHVETQGAALSVTLHRVIDPLRGSGAVLQPGTRAVGVVVQIRNAGPAIYDSSATGDFSVVSSSGIVTPVLAKRGVCRTPLEDFDRYITAGEDRVGCVVFAVPDRATVTAVRFSPHAQAAGRVVWAG